nr:hypothetical protein [Pandoravirus massiliensis]
MKYTLSARPYFFAHPFSLFFPAKAAHQPYGDQHKRQARHTHADSMQHKLAKTSKENLLRKQRLKKVGDGVSKALGPCGFFYARICQTNRQRGVPAVGSRDSLAHKTFAQRRTLAARRRLFNNFFGGLPTCVQRQKKEAVLFCDPMAREAPSAYARP